LDASNKALSNPIRFTDPPLEVQDAVEEAAEAVDHDASESEEEIGEEEEGGAKLEYVKMQYFVQPYKS
jgi:hypothetical protein